ncbi:MAG: SDR family NAD(P)-dependent oxidoreductase [Marmoricola sp.]
MSRHEQDLQGRVVAVTGGARGIGEATAAALARAGARVAVGDLDVDLARRSAATYGGLALPLDVSDADSFAEFLETVSDRLGPLDGLVNNAGFMVIGRAHEVSLERQLAQIDVNLRGVIRGSHLAADRMRGGGVIVNIASLAGRVPMPGGAVYSATKAAVLAYTEALDAELSDRGVRVCAVLPSFTATELIAGTHAHGATRPIQPSDVADAVVSVLRRPRASVVVPRRFTASAVSWSSTPSRLKPWLRARFGLDTIFTEPDLQARTDYDTRTGALTPRRGPGPGRR